MKSVNLMFRILLTAYGFIRFAAHVLWLSKWVMPRIMNSDDKTIIEKRQAALWQAHKHVKSYLSILNRLGLISFKFVGKPVEEPALIVANHPSLIDFIVLLKDFPNSVCLFKKQTKKNPILADFVKVAGYVEGMDGTREASERIISDCCQRLDEGHHVVVFPEGTRSASNLSVGRFRTTVFYAALKANVTIQPVSIYCAPSFLGKKQSWTDFARQNNVMVIEYLEPIDIKDFSHEGVTPQAIAEESRQKILNNLASLSECY
jgi:1-acyl-sn-glycerol-3-phosphate acyltransferase